MTKSDEKEVSPISEITEESTTAEKNIESNKKVESASGHVTSHSTLVRFLYLLLRDHLPFGTVERIIMEAGAERKDIAEAKFTNGWAAKYAKNIAGRMGYKEDL